MITIERFTLENGLKVLVHTDSNTPIASFNLLYNVGARDENPDRTGFAHLFEHLMFGGTANIPVFDEPLERIGGENNAFTSNDITNYYITLPKENLETAFWLESDRMNALDFSQRSLDTQKSVVIEEFRQSYLNQPYGDVWLLLRPLAYKTHPYLWPTIGKSPQHIEEASLDEVKNFFYSHYAPNNAILCVSGNVKRNEVETLSKKWFGSIEKRELKKRNLPIEPQQIEPRRLEVERNVPFDAIYLAFHMCGRLNPDFHATDLISDILSNGKSSRLHQNLLKGKRLFSDIDAFISGDYDPGLFVVTGRLIDGVSFHDAENAILSELNQLSTEGVSEYELEKVKNRFESKFEFGLTDPLEVAINLCTYELISKAEDINYEVGKYRKVSSSDIKRVASTIFKTSNCSTLFYKSINE
jgi:predicted Zn-dependent peptidase